MAATRRKPRYNYYSSFATFRRWDRCRMNPRSCLIIAEVDYYDYPQDATLMYDKLKPGIQWPQQFETIHTINRTNHIPAPCHLHHPLNGYERWHIRFAAIADGDTI